MNTAKDIIEKSDHTIALGIVEQETFDERLLKYVREALKKARYVIFKYEQMGKEYEEWQVFTPFQGITAKVEDLTTPSTDEFVIWLYNNRSDRAYWEEIDCVDSTTYQTIMAEMQKQMYHDKMGNNLLVRIMGKAIQFITSGFPREWIKNQQHRKFITYFYKNGNPYFGDGKSNLGLESFSEEMWASLPDMYLSYIDNLGTIMHNGLYISPEMTTALYMQWNQNFDGIRRYVIASPAKLGMGVVMQWIQDLMDHVPYIKMGEVGELVKGIYPRFYSFDRMDALNYEFPTYEKMEYDIHLIRQQPKLIGFSVIGRTWYDRMVEVLTNAGLMDGITFVDAPEGWREGPDSDDDGIPDYRDPDSEPGEVTLHPYTGMPLDSEGNPIPQDKPYNPLLPGSVPDPEQEPYWDEEEEGQHPFYGTAGRGR